MLIASLTMSCTAVGVVADVALTGIVDGAVDKALSKDSNDRNYFEKDNWYFTKIGRSIDKAILNKTKNTSEPQTPVESTGTTAVVSDADKLVCNGITICTDDLVCYCDDK